MGTNHSEKSIPPVYETLKQGLGARRLLLVVSIPPVYETLKLSPPSCSHDDSWSIPPVYETLKPDITAYADEEPSVDPARLRDIETDDGSRSSR